jgi:hypothetical protein
MLFQREVRKMEVKARLRENDFYEIYEEAMADQE